MLNLIRRDRRSDDGGSAVEYSLLVAAIAAIIVLVVFAVGRVTKETYAVTCGNLSAEISAAGVSCTG